MLDNRWVIAIAAACIHLCIGSVYAYGILAKFIIDVCGFSATATTFVFSTSIFFLGCGAAGLSRFVDRIGPRKVGICAGIAYMIGFFISALAIYLNSIILLYVGYGCIVGICTGTLYTVPIGSLVKQFKSRPGMAGSIAIASFGLAAFIASFLITLLVTNFGLISNFIILGILYGTTIIVSSLCLPNKGSKQLINNKNDSDSILLPKDVYKTWQFKSLFLSFFNNIGAGIAILAVIALMMIENFGFSILDAAFFVSLCSIANSSGRFIWANLSDIVGCSNMYVFFAVVGTICYTTIALTSNLYLFEIAVMTVISLYGGFFSTMPSYLKTLFSDRYLSSIHGTILFSWGLAGIFCGSLLPIGKDLFGTYTPVLCLFIIMMLINTVILWKIKKDSDSRGDYIHDIR